MEIGIFTKGLPEQAQQRAAGLEGMPATSGEAIGAAFDEALRFNPAASLFRAARRAMGESPMLAPEEAAARYGLDGRLKFSEPTPEHVARDLYELKLQELRLQSIRDRSPGGALQMLGSFGAGFAGSALDPINIASAFVPVVGATRMAAWSAAWGVNRARLAKGAVEGAVGAAVVEPLTFGVARAEQADYDALDSLLNVTFGAALGGGLHWAGGAIGDAFSGRRVGTPGVPPTNAPPAGPAQLGGSAGPATPPPAPPPPAPAPSPATAPPPGAARLEPAPGTPPGAAPLPDELEAYAPAIPTVPARQVQPPPAAPPLLTLAVDSQPLAWREAALRTAVVELATFGEIRGLDGELVIPGAAAAARGQVERAAIDAAATLMPELDAPLPVAQAMALARSVEPEAVAALPTVRAADLVERTPEQLRVDAELFQFKSGGDAAGVTDRLRGVKTWDQKLAGITLVWQRADGVEFIADGHQRHGLATRLAAEGQAPRLNAYLLREVDGYSAASARIFAAFKNIAEGSGSALDAARVLREARLDPAMARYADQLPPLPPSSPLVRDARSLAELGDDAFRMVINEVVDQAHAAHVGRLIRDPQQQVAALGVLARAEPRSSNEARLLVEQIRDAGFSAGQQQTLFGADAFAKSLFVQRAKVLDRATASLRKDKAVFSTLIDESGRITAAGNALSAEANQRRLSDNETLILLLADATRAGSPIARELDDAARRLDAGEPVTRVAAAFLGAVRQRISEGLDLGQLSRRAGPDGEAQGGAGSAGAGPDQVAPEPPDPRQAGMFQPPPAFGERPAIPLQLGSVRDPAELAGRFAAAWDERIGFTDGVLRLRREILDEGTRTGMEHMTVADAQTGAVLAGRSGRRDGVDFDQITIDALADPVSRLVLQHNHPSSSSFSAADLAALGQPGATAIFAHGHNGTDYVALRPDHLPRTAGMPSNAQNVTLASMIAKEWHEIDDELYRRLRPRYEAAKTKALTAVSAPLERDAIVAQLVNEFSGAHRRLQGLALARCGLIRYADTAPLADLDRVMPVWRSEIEAFVAARHPVIQSYAVQGGDYLADFDRLSRALREPGELAAILDADPGAAAVAGAGRGDPARAELDRQDAAGSPAGGAGPGLAPAARGRRRVDPGVRPEPGFDPGQRQGRLLEAAAPDRVQQHLDRPGVIIAAEIQKLAPEAQAILRQSYRRAAELKDGFDALLERIAADIGGRALLPSLKGSARAVEKIAKDYKGDAGKIKDLLRATIEVDTVDQARAVVALLRQPFDVLDAGFRDLFDAAVDPVDGYRDAKMNVQLPGLVAEIQVNLPQMLAAKKRVHGEYEERSTLQRNIENEKRKATPQEEARIAELNAAMKIVYDAAFAEAMSARNFASETGAPLRLAEFGSKDRGGSSSQAAEKNGTPGTLPKETGMPSTSKNSTSEGNFMGGTSAQNVSASAGSFNAPAVDLVATVDGQRAQIVLPGAERISTAELLRRRQGQAGTQRQQSGRAGAAPASDLPLFGSQRNQGSLFETAHSAYGPTVRQEVVIAETGERFEMERPAAAVLAETETRVERLKRALACLRQ